MSILRTTFAISRSKRWRVLLICAMSSSRCFFFQAEDGIRDLTVTGVQTCALPISIPHGGLPVLFECPPDRPPVLRRGLHHHFLDLLLLQPLRQQMQFPWRSTELAQIGRASCRERV